MALATSEKQIMSKEHDRAMMENLYWWGVPTLFRTDHKTDPSGLDVALVRVPHSGGNGTTERDQHLGPRALRNVSAVQRRVHMNFGIDPWKMLEIADLGDVPFPEANDNEASIQRITDFYQTIDKAGARPISVGGDHSITGGILQALGGKGTNIAKGEKIALLHTDVFTSVDHFLGAKKSAAHWGAYLADQGHIDPTKSVQIGLRGNPRTLDWLQGSYDYGYNVVTMAEYRAKALEHWVEMIPDVIGDTPLYITFDLDCLDPTIAPSVSNLEPGEQGFLMGETIALLRSVRGLNIIGGDIACMMPTKDSRNQITALSAGSVMFEMISLIADKLGKS